MEGKLSDLTFSELLGDIYQKNINGILTLAWGDLWKLLYIENGKLNYIVSNQEEENLLEFLLSLEAIPHDEARKIQKTINGKTLYRALLNSHCVPEEDLANYNDMLCKGIIFSLFNWVLGTFHFRECTASQKIANQLSYSIPELILEGVRRINDYQIIKFRLGKLHHIISISNAFYQQAKDLPLTPSETFIISRIGEKNSIQEIIDMTMLEEEEVCRCIFALKCSGFLTITPSKESEPELPDSGKRTYDEYRFIETVKDFANKIPSLEDNEIMGLEPAFDFDSLMNSFQELSEKYNPEKYTIAAYNEIKEQLHFISSSVLRAYLRLRASAIPKPSLSKLNDVTEAEKRGLFALFDSTAFPPLKQDEKPDAKQAVSKADITTAQEETPQDAQALFLKAQETANTGDYFQAVQLCETAIKLNNKVPEYYLLLIKIYCELPRLADKAIESYYKYLELEPKNTEVRLQLAKFLMKSADFISAQNELLRIIEIDPEHLEAKKLIQEIPST